MDCHVGPCMTNRGPKPEVEIALFIDVSYIEIYVFLITETGFQKVSKGEI